METALIGHRANSAQGRMALLFALVGLFVVSAAAIGVLNLLGYSRALGRARALPKQPGRRAAAVLAHLGPRRARAGAAELRGS